ncbi:MAG: aminopeptidase P family protein [Pseudomonadota bacterium]
MESPAENLAALRAELSKRCLDGFVVPLTDEHMSEYVAPYAKRLAWLTGFLGSAGTAVVLADKAALFIDGRYTIQAKDEVDETLFALVDFPATTPAQWLEKNAAPGQRIGYDPWLHGIAWVEETQGRLAAIDAELVALDDNPIDAVWASQPARPTHPIVPHDVTHAGLTHDEKLAAIAEAIAAARADACVLAALDSIAWAFNIRGADIANTPVGLAFAIVDKHGAAQLFTDPEKVAPPLARHLGEAVRLAPRDEFAAALDALGKARAVVLLDKTNIVAAIFARLQKAGARIVKGRDPTLIPKACKNAVEAEGARAAHVRDGAAVCEFLAWFESEALKGGLSEIAAADYLAARRRRRNLFQDLSFRTISAAGPHAAIPHYSVTPRSNLEIPLNSVFLIDSGGQYLDGTTDITRTVAVGDAPLEARQRFTLVLKGHIALATARFPEGTPGRALDTLARQALWRSGLDFDHGTGHGVGSYLAVHEGPQRIAKANADEPLRPGMILSNEPGYYKAGAYGIRIENLVLIREARAAGDERPMLGFETLTLAPIDRTMIEASLLDDGEKDWLNGYHAMVWARLADEVDPAIRPWLEQATRPI